MQDIAHDPEFHALPPTDKQAVFDRVGGQDSEFSALSTEDQGAVRSKILGIQPAAQVQQPSTLSKIASGAMQGIGDVVSSIPKLGAAIVGAPAQVTSDIQDLWNNPAAAIPAQAKRAANFAWGMVPFSETIGKVLSGQPLSAQDVSRDVTRTGVSLLAPPVVGGLMKRGMRGFVKNLPGAGVELQDLAIQKADALAQRLTPGQPQVRAAYEAASQTGNPTIAMSSLQNVARDVLAHETQASQPNNALIAQANNIIGSSGTGWSWSQAISEVRRMGEQVRAYRKIHGEVPKEMSDLYSALRTDLEQANPLQVTSPSQPARPASTLLNAQGQPFQGAIPAQPAITQIGAPTPQTMATSTAWQDAQKLARRQFAAEDLQGQINSAIGTAGEGFNSFSVNRVLKWIQQQERGATLGHPDTKARMFIQSWSPGELADIKTTLQGISKNMAALPTMSGTAVGSSQRVQQAAIGAAIGSTFGEASTGGIVGVLTADLIGRAMVTPYGRAMVRRAARIAPATSPQFNQLLGAWMRQAPDSASTSPNNAPPSRVSSPDTPQPATAPLPVRPPIPNGEISGGTRLMFQNPQVQSRFALAENPASRDYLKVLGVTPNNEADREVLNRIIGLESGGKSIKSGKDSGVFQFNPQNAKLFGVNEASPIEAQVRAAEKRLAALPTEIGLPANLNEADRTRILSTAWLAPEQTRLALQRVMKIKQ